MVYLTSDGDRMTEPDYHARAAAGVRALQRWYVRHTGVWKTTGWWQSANALSAVIRYTRHTGDRNHVRDLEHTFSRARRAHADFINMFFDDCGWWGLAWVDAYDLTGESRYLDAARTIFAHNQTGWDGTCGGGVWWNTERTYKNAVTNELFFTLAALLHQRTPGDQEYLSWALRGWEWLAARALIGPSGLINDGLTADCANNGGPTWTYNQGVVLGGLAALHDITGDRDYLRHGEFIADATLSRLTSPQGILTELCEPCSAAMATSRSSRASSRATCTSSTCAAASRPTASSCWPTPTPSGTTPGTPPISSGCAGPAPSTRRTPAGSRRLCTSSSPPPRSPRGRGSERPRERPGTRPQVGGGYGGIRRAHR